MVTIILKKIQWFQTANVFQVQSIDGFRLTPKLSDIETIYIMRKMRTMRNL